MVAVSVSDENVEELLAEKLLLKVNSTDPEDSGVTISYTYGCDSIAVFHLEAA